MALEQKILLGVCIEMVGVGMHRDLPGRVAKMGSIMDWTPHCPPMVGYQKVGFRVGSGNELSVPGWVVNFRVTRPPKFLGFG